MYNLIQGDCLQEMDKLISTSVKVDMILTDPPYGTTACKWDSVIPFEPMWKRINELIKPNGCIALFGTEPFSSLLRCSNMDNYKHDWIWNKEVCGSFVLAKKRPMSISENISVFSSGGGVVYYPIMEDAIKKNIRPINTGSSLSETIKIASGTNKCNEDYNPKKRYPRNIITYSKYNKECNQLNRLHPTQKPVALLEYLIKTYTNEGETVLDFTMGSGSTGVACINTNRNFIGIELDQKYYNIAKSRLEEVQK